MHSQGGQLGRRQRAPVSTPRPGGRAFANLLLAGTLVVAGMSVGCLHDSPPRNAAYFGPTEPMNEVVDAINRNNVRLPTLWGRGYFEANVVDKQHGGRKSFVNGDVIVLYRQPGDVRLVGKKDVAGTVFEIGSNAEQYWLILKGEQDTMWWGNQESAGSVDPGVMPIQPMLLLDVLGIGTLGREFLRPPVPVMRFNNDADAYMFVWSAPLPDRWAAQKEVWYDRATKLPKLVILFDENGRVLLRAYLSNHRKVDTGNGDAPDAPMLATRYKLYFPDSGTTMSFDLADVMLSRSGAPNDRSFSFPGDKAGVSRTISVDEHADTPTTTTLPPARQ